MNILVIEDDKAIAQIIEMALDDVGHKTVLAHNGKGALELALREKFDVLVVDRMLPELDGLSLVRTLRARGIATPAIFLSAMGDVDDRVEGLRAGGDDYLAKPFSMDELLARIEARGRRQETGGTNVITRLSSGDLEMDLIARTVTRGGKNVDLQQREFQLLEYLMRNKGKLVTRSELLENVWDYHFDPQTNIIDVHISRLRGKIGKGPEKPLLKTVRGAGYILEDK